MIEDTLLISILRPIVPFSGQNLCSAKLPNIFELSYLNTQLPNIFELSYLNTHSNLSYTRARDPRAGFNGAYIIPNISFSESRGIPYI